MKLILPWPPRQLSPNARKHWRALAKHKKHYRLWCWQEASLQHHFGPAGDRFDVRLTFHPPDRRKRDRDNLLAAMKSGLDGMCDALFIDDAQFARVTVEVGAPVKGGSVEVELVALRQAVPS